MTWLDLVTIVICSAVVVVEAARGFVPAMIDLIGVLVLLSMAGGGGVGVSGPSPGRAGTYLAIVVVGAAVIATASTLFNKYTKWDIGPFDRALAGLMGVGTGIALSHAAFDAALLAYGASHPALAHSLLRAEVYEFRTAKAIANALRNLGGGKTAVEEARDKG